MKKNILTMMLFAVAAIASVSCQKEDHIASAEPVTLTFTSANPETKTEWNEENQTIWWSDKDKIRMALKINDEWYRDENSKIRYYVSSQLSGASETAEFKISASFNTNLMGDYQFYALYPSDCTGTSAEFASAPNASYTISGTQSSTSGTFDKSADVLWGKAVNTYTQLPTDVPVPLMWTRLVAHAQITLKSINGIEEGEKINSITLTAQENAPFVGKYDLDITNGTVKENKTANSLTVNCSDIVADASGNVTFWACINPCTVTSLNIVVDTDVATYTIDKQNLNLAFLQNQRNILPVNMSAAVHEQKAVDDTDYSGDWLITGTKTDGTMVAAGAYVSGNNINAIVGVTLTDGTFEYVDGIENCKMNIEKVTDGTYAGKYTIKDANGLYLYAAGANSYNYLKAASLDVNNSVFYWSISIVDGQPSSLVATGCDRNDLRFYRNSNYFSCYAANTSASKVTLYPYSMVAVGTTPEIVISSEKPIVVGAEAGEVTINYTIKNPVDDAGVQASTNVDWLTDVRYADGTVTYTVEENTGAERKATVTLSYEGATSVEVVITQAADTGDTPETPAEGYVLVTSLDEVTTGEYVIAALHEGKYYAMNGTLELNTYKVLGVEVVVDNGVISTQGAETYSLNIVHESNSWYISNGSNFLAYNTGTNFKLQKDAYSWTITYDANTSVFKIQTEDSARCILMNTSNNFGPYAASNLGNAKYFNTQLFKKKSFN